MIPIRDNMVARQSATVTWTLIGLNVLIYLWDRGGALAGPNVAFADLAMRPAEVVRAVSGNGDPTELGKLFTSMFLHGGLVHLIGNVIFLLAFGPNVEVALGSVRYVLYYLFWGLVASLAHILVDPGSTIPTLGASGAIGGVLGCYFLLFPANRITVIVPPFFFFPFAVPAWVLLGLWFVWQILFPQAGVANWAHAGGFLAGMVTVLIMGGRQSVLKDREQDWEYDEDDEYEFA
jgi:membrane associated rhomboid family serine protease